MTKVLFLGAWAGNLPGHGKLRAAEGDVVDLPARAVDRLQLKYPRYIRVLVTEQEAKSMGKRVLKSVRNMIAPAPHKET